MDKGIIYYTDNRLGEPIFSTVQEQIAKSGLPIVSVSLKPISFGRNIVLDLRPSYVTMLKQITKALGVSTTETVFFCEHDVLYPKSHFDFVPPKSDVWYYNENVWRWDYPHNRAISYDRLISLSGLAVNRELALEHYQLRLKKIYELGYDRDTSREPLWARRWGYEPGTKKTTRGGFSDDDFEKWSSRVPMVDIRHGKTFSQSKVTLASFIHKPHNFRETTLDKLPGWDLKAMFS